MSVPVDQLEAGMGIESPLAVTSTWTINVSDIRTVKITNISLNATARDIQELFSFSGDIRYVEMRRESEMSQLAYVTFKESQGADTAMLLSGATIVDRSVNITPVENYHLPPSAYSELERKSAPDSPLVKKAEDVVSSVLAKGFIIGKDAINKAKAFDEQHKLSLNASAAVASLDQKMGLSEKLYTGTTIVNYKAREVDERYGVVEKTKSALAAAEQKASSAGSVLMTNRYVSTGASWVSNALNMVAKAAENVTSLTKEKVEKAEAEKQQTLYHVRTGMVSDYAQIHFDDAPQLSIPSGGPAVVPVESREDHALGII